MLNRVLHQFAQRTAAKRALVAVVDDEPAVRKSLERLLRAADFEVITFSSGQDFLDSVQFNPPNCAVADLHMPGPTGLDIQERLRADGIRVPVVIITARDDLEVRRRCLKLGAAGYLRKPLDGADLLNVINAALEISDESASH